MTFEYTFWNFLVSLVMTSFFGWFFNRLKKRPVIYVLKPDLGQWLDINNNPVPASDAFEYFIATDGEKVDAQYYKKYDCKGRLVLSTYGPTKYVKYWRPLPLPPKANY